MQNISCLIADSKMLLLPNDGKDCGQRCQVIKDIRKICSNRLTVTFLVSPSIKHFNKILLTYSLTHSLIYLLTYLLTCLLAYLLQLAP